VINDYLIQLNVIS